MPHELIAGKTLIGGQYAEDVYLMYFFAVWIFAAFALTVSSTVILSRSTCSAPLSRPCKTGVWLGSSGYIALGIPMAVFLSYLFMRASSNVSSFFFLWIAAAYTLAIVGTVGLTRNYCNRNGPYSSDCKNSLWYNGSGQVGLFVPLAVFLLIFFNYGTVAPYLNL